MENSGAVHAENTGRDKLRLGPDAEDYVTEILENCVWRRAVTVDGKTYWSKKDGGIGEPICSGSFKYRRMDSYMLLAPIETDPEEHPGAESERINK